MRQRRLSAIQWIKRCDNKGLSEKKVDTNNKRKYIWPAAIRGGKTGKLEGKIGSGKEKDAGQKKMRGNVGNKRRMLKKAVVKCGRKEAEKNCGKCG
ncbi:MAG: hypothetical protein ACI4AE_03705 [Candidatus Cryptobacteroides sp.]